MTDRPDWIRLEVERAYQRTLTMSSLAAGCYIKLVYHQLYWGCVLPDDMRALDRLVPGTRRVWAEISHEFVRVDGGLVNQHAAEKRAEAMAKLEGARTSGRLGGIRSAEVRAANASDRHGTDPDGGEDGRRSSRRRPSDPSSDHSSNRSRVAQATLQTTVQGSLQPESKSEREKDIPSSSSNGVKGRSGATPQRRDDDDGSERRSDQPDDGLEAMVRLLPARLSPNELAEARSILASWDPRTVRASLRRYLTDAKRADFPHRYILTCLRNHRDEDVEVERPAIAGRIDPTLARSQSDQAAAAESKAATDAALAGLDDEALGRLKARAVALAEPNARLFLERGDPRTSRLLRVAMAAALAHEATA